MHRFSLPFVVALLVPVLVACGGKQKIRVAVDASAPPFEYLDSDTQKIIGFDIGLMDAIASKAGLEVEYVNESFDVVMTDLAGCKVDAAISMIAITETRKDSMAFSDRYFQLGQLLIVRSLESEITGPGSLNGKLIGAQFGTPGALEAEKIYGAMMFTYDSIDLAFTALQNGEIDAVIADNAISLGFIHRSNGQFKVAGDILGGQDIAIAVCKTDNGLLEKINSGLQAVRSDGALDRLINQWIAGPG